MLSIDAVRCLDAFLLKLCEFSNHFVASLVIRAGVKPFRRPVTHSDIGAKLISRTYVLLLLIRTCPNYAPVSWWKSATIPLGSVNDDLLALVRYRGALRDVSTEHVNHELIVFVRHPEPGHHLVGRAGDIIILRERTVVRKSNVRWIYRHLGHGLWILV